LETNPSSQRAPIIRIHFSLPLLCASVFQFVP
jgi:hypothetical protein